MDQFESKLDKSTAAPTIPGVYISAVDKRDKQYSYTSGYHSVSNKTTPISPDSIFAILSCTKIVTCIAALQCVDRGLITLDEPVSPHLPELAALDIITMHPVDPENPAQIPPGLPYTEPSAATFAYAPPSGKISLRHLLAQTAGVGADYLDPLSAWRKSRGEECMVMKGDIVANSTMPCVHEPGASWSYGVCLDWVGLLVGRLNKTTFGRYLDEHVFEALGMRDCGFHLEEREDLRARLVDMNVRREGGRALVRSEHQIRDPIRDECGGGGLYASGPDFTKLLADLVREEPVLLKPETAALLFEPQLEMGGAAQRALMKYAPFFDHYIPCPLGTLNHGLGGLLVMEDDLEAGIPKGTLSWSGSSGPMWAANREKGVVWYFATQVPFGDVESGELCREFAKLVFAGTATK